MMISSDLCGYCTRYVYQNPPLSPQTVKSANPIKSLCPVTLAAAMTFSIPLYAQPAAPAAASGQEVAPAGDELTWPREFEDNGTKVDIYQPQIEKWEGADFETRSALRSEERRVG